MEEVLKVFHIHLQKGEPGDVDPIDNILLQTLQIISGTPLQEDVQCHSRPLLLDLLDQVGQIHGVTDLYNWAIMRFRIEIEMEQTSTK